jgi:hypothetical protein
MKIILFGATGMVGSGVLRECLLDSLYLAPAVAEECALITADAKFHSALVASPLAAHVQWVEDTFPPR